MVVNDAIQGTSKKAVLSPSARPPPQAGQQIPPASVAQTGTLRSWSRPELLGAGGDDKANLFGVYQRLITRPALLSASGQCIPGSGNVLDYAGCGVAGAQQCGRAGQHKKAESNYC